MKKSAVVAVSVIILVLSIFTVAAVDVGVSSLTPAGISWRDNSNNVSYEYAAKQYKIDFDTSDLPSSDILYANITVNGGIVNDVLDPTVCTKTGSNVVVCDGDFQTLSVNVTSSDVGADTGYTWEINAVDNVSGSVKQNLSFTVKNDNSAPRVNSVSPLRYSIIKNQTFDLIVGYTEQESGFKSGNFWYDDSSNYNNDIRGSVTADGIDFVCTSTTCDSTFNPNTKMGLSNNQFYFDAYFNLSDNAGNINNSVLYHLYIDTFAPDAIATSPENNIHINTATQNYGYYVNENTFNIDSSFNSNKKVNCSVYINETYKNSSLVTSNSTQTLSSSLADLADGTYYWYVSCTDVAGWSDSTIVQTFILDTTGPVIALTSPADASVIANGTTVQLSVADSLSNISKVWFSLDDGATNQSLIASPYQIDSAVYFTEGLNTLKVYSNDTLNNPSSTTFTFTVDTDAPQIDLIFPGNNTFGNGLFQVNATDDHSNTFSCSLTMAGSVVDTQTVTNKEYYTYDVDYADGDYLWNVNCTDKVGNKNISEDSWTVKFDSTPPSVTLLTPDSTTNTNGVSDFNYHITEANFANCTLLVENADNGTVLGVAANFTSISTGLASRDPAYSWKLVCGDLAGNKVTTSAKQFYYDVKKPVISDVLNSSIDSSSANISWVTDEVSNHTVYYGLNAENLTSSLQALTSATTPSLIITSLSASTTYSYLVQSCDQWNNCKNDSTVYNFTTTSAPASSSSGGGGGGGGDSCARGYERVGGVCTLIVEEVQEVASSCDPLWRCREWSACTDGQQTRTCEDWSLCGVSDGKPAESQECEGDGSTTGTDSDSSATDLSNSADGQANPLGVGQATGIFGIIQSNWKPLAGSLGILSLLGLMFWQRGSLSTAFRKIANFKQVRMQKREEEVRQKLRKEGLIK